MFLTFQAPVEIPGVLYAHFLKLVACRAGTAPSLAYKLKLVLKLVGVSVRALSRPVNVGFSGGERRLLELVQMVVMEPDVCVLDEVDSGLDAHKLAILTKLVLAFGASRRCLLVITHSLDLMLALAPDSVYCLKPRGMAYSTRGACKLAACALR